MQYTTNFNLKEPQYADEADVEILNDNFEDIDDVMHQNRLMLAEPFDQTKAYSAGKMVVYEGASYKFKVDHAAGNWNASQVEQMPIADGASGGGEVTKTVTGNPIEITDAASAPIVRCVTQITGSQDLHGYDKPWIPGAEKNKTDQADVTMSAAGYVIGTGSTTEYINADQTVYPAGTYTISFDLSDAAYPFNCQAALFDGSTNVSDTPTVRIESGGRKSITITASAAFDKWKIYSASSSGGTFANFMIEAGSVPSSYAPYSNICPITAYTEGEIEVSSGADVYSTDGLTGYQSNSKVEIISDKAVRCYTTQAGTYMSANQLISPFSLTIGKTYTLECDVTVTSGVGALAIRNSSYNAIVLTDNITQSGHYKLTFEMPSNAYFVAFFSTMNTSANGDVTYSHIRLYEGTERNTHTTTFPNSIYRGSEDVVNGEVESKMPLIDLDTCSPTTRYTGSVNKTISFTLPYSYSYSSGSSWVLNCLSEYFKYIGRVQGATALNNPDNHEVGIYAWYASGTGPVWTLYIVAPLSVSSYGDFAYLMATPTTTPVTPTNLPIKSLLGYNHIESTTGDMEVEYITKGYQPIIDLEPKIEANPADAPTQTLTTLKINGVTYSLPSGGGGGEVVRASNTITISGGVA